MYDTSSSDHDVLEGDCISPLLRIAPAVGCRRVLLGSGFCRTKSLEQSPAFTARTHRHQNFETQFKDLSFSAGLSLNLCSSIRFVYILFYFSSRYVICWSILFL